MIRRYYYFLVFDDDVFRGPLAASREVGAGHGSPPGGARLHLRARGHHIIAAEAAKECA